MNPRRVVFATFGSLGDLHPYLAVARELKKRGHAPLIATAEYHRATIENAGLEFFAARPDLPRENLSAHFARVMEPRGGTKYLFQKLILPSLRESYDDLSRAMAGADLLITHSLAPAGVLVAQKQKLPWISGVVSPIFFYSRHDPPLMPIFPALAKLPIFGPLWTKFLMKTVVRRFEPIFAPLYELRAELGLPRGPLPLFAGQHSPHKVLALFSRALAVPQADWPPHTVVTGFCSLEEQRELSPAAHRFLQDGAAPLVFTLGASSTHDPGDFWEQSARAARLLNRRALFLTGRDDVQTPRGVTAFSYEPLAEILPHAAALVHHGGAGTIALALRAGVPQLIMPHANDQFDNAARLARHGTARLILRSQYKALRVANALKTLTENQEVKQRCDVWRKIIAGEHGAQTAADEIEKFLFHHSDTEAQRGI